MVNVDVTTLVCCSYWLGYLCLHLVLRGVRCTPLSGSWVMAWQLIWAGVYRCFFWKSGVSVCAPQIQFSVGTPSIFLGGGGFHAKNTQNLKLLLDVWIESRARVILLMFYTEWALFYLNRCTKKRSTINKLSIIEMCVSVVCKSESWLVVTFQAKGHDVCDRKANR